MKPLITIILTLIVLTLISCSPSSRRAGSLSDAMEKASDDYHGERKVDAVVEVEEPEYIPADSTFITYERSNENEPLKDLWLGLKFGTGVLSTKSFYGVTSFAFTGNQFVGERNSLSFDIGLEYSPLQTTQTAEFVPEEDKIVKALDGGVITLFAGMDYRYYTTPKHTFIGNYFSAGAGVKSMFWSYKNPIEIREYDEYGNYTGTETISGDQLWGFDINAALGLNYIQFKHFSLGIEFNPRITIWGFNTYEGFSNDMFYPFLYLKTNFNLMINGGE
ncbi:MAG: hypothetical protein JXN63_03570 [Candidatus Delongbacteria bacterium]|nr:hypothetical protein [Candidatus Delongbacteria bacterium]